MSDCRTFMESIQARQVTRKITDIMITVNRKSLNRSVR